ncbi:molybdate ABC transporter substrate-binding protein [Thalassotalea sp. G2M2-11]|uniref:molybdate ABC transporter substrate-binding protein n=1 Tax=Thalassotalea sp. G2M2-11 TaxID=2787627 RepID=UPI0019D114C1|nr:molybdate ABC transporter substrate-binding protein [Thalassotalea sp. G2M2-11]
MYIRHAFIILILLLSFTSLATPNNKVLRIAVSANFAEPLKALLPTFHQNTGIHTQVITGSTGNLFQQIVHGAPFDIFLAADSIRPNKLVELGLADAKQVSTYTIGELAFWSAKWHDASAPPSIEKVIQQLTLKEQRFAIANPTIAPYGKAAKQALTSLKLWPIPANKLVTGININQTFQQLRTGAVPIGIVAHSQLKQNNLTGMLIPTTHYQAITQQLVILSHSSQQAQAKKLRDFLLSDHTQAQLQAQGYQAVSSTQQATRRMIN